MSQLKLKIKVMYNKKHKIDRKLDNGIHKLLKGAGLKFVGSGVNFITGERDLCFEGKLK